MTPRQENMQNRIYLVTVNSFDEQVVLQELTTNFPNLIFRNIAPQIYTIEVSPSAEAEFQRFRDSQGNTVVDPVLYGLNIVSALEASNITSLQNEVSGDLRGRGTIIGIVDTGIQYTNNVFLNADNTTRILAIWDQTIEGNPPQDYNYGTVYNSDQINAALKSTNPLAVVPSTDSNGHGTFLAGIAAGNDQTSPTGYRGGAPDAQLMVVKLRPASEQLREEYVIEPDAIAYQENDIIAGIEFLIEEAGLKYPNQPIAICLGLGSNYGPHNGTGILESYLATSSLIRNVVITVSAGNEGNTGHHYAGQIRNDDVQDIEINVPADSRGFTLNIWPNLPDKIAIAVKSPLGQVIEKVAIRPNQNQSFRFNLERTQMNVMYNYPDIRTGGQRVDITLREPTEGIWTVSIYGESIVNGIYNMWLPRRNFVKEGTRFLRSTPETTVQNPGTNEYSFVIGAYNDIDDSIYVATGRGPTTSNSIKPDIIAPGVNVEGPSIAGGTTTYVGTSVAAAITTSAAAILMQWAIVNGNLSSINTRIAKGILLGGARRQANVTYPNNIEGYGRLDLKNSIANI